MKGSLFVHDYINIAPGVFINFQKFMVVDAENVADILRQFVFTSTQVDDDTRSYFDWFYQEQPPGIFIADKSCQVSEDPKLVQLMKTADLLDGRNHRLES